VSLLTDILVWATAYLLPWQRDALRRLFQQQELTPQDLDDLYAMLKSARGVPDPENRSPVPLAQEHLPAKLSTSEPIILKAVRDLKHVNRIAEGQQLAFAPKGITVVYGGNASGKSGYSRVLKRACRARDVLETVHPDASDPKAKEKIPEAIFDIEVGGHPKSLNWKRDVAPPDELSTIAVFDARCARAYLDEQDVAFLPYGLDIMENLGQRVLPELSRRLSAEISSISTDLTPFADLSGNTTVGKLIASLSETTSPEKVKALATLTTEETNHLAELDQTLAENDPRAKANAVKLSAQRVDGLIARIDTASAWVNDAAVQKLKSCDAETEAAIQAEAIAAGSFQASEPLLPGTGEQVWKTLFEAARSFSVESAYPDESFPHVCPGARCPLCQQPLDQETAKRLQRFEEFVKRDTAKVAADKLQKRTTAEQKVAQASLDFGLDAATTEELKQLDATLLQAVQGFEKKVDTRRQWMLHVLKTHAWDDSPLLDGDPHTELKRLSTNLWTQASDLEKASDGSQRKTFEAERAELRDRSRLSPRLTAVLNLIRWMQVKSILTGCKDDLKTKAISDKAKELASQAVTATLKTALDTEFQVLGVGHVKTKLAERVEKGQMKHKLVLDLPVTTKPVIAKLDEILSEGEQRAIAIGSFLAELRLADHAGGIVFDDPVSSLDHYRRKKVACRLVEEAKKRQVIVLTHETVFLGELLDAIEQQEVDHLMYHLEWMNDRPGHVSEGLPWEHKSYKDRLDKLEKAQKTLQKSWPVYPNEEDRAKIRRQYGLLRATIERIIQDVVFNRVVQRHRDWIRVDRLEDVVGFMEAEYKEIARLHKACCEVVDSHDPSSAKNAPVPDADKLGKEIKDLKAVVESIQARRKQGATDGPPGTSS
jgi:hypothetical protein